MKLILILIGLTLLASVSFAQTTELDRLYPGYVPTVFHSYDEVTKVFDDQMPMGFKTGNWGPSSQCYQRAELWSYNFYRNYRVNAMKVFVFYTHTYRQAYHAMYGKKFEWWFHVAPYLLVRDASTQILKEFVVDPTFSDTPQEMKPWTDMFVETHRKCAEFVPFEKFEAEVRNGPDAIFGKEHCYIVRSPATDYDPTDVEARSLGQKTGFVYGMDELHQAVTYAPTARMRGWWKAQLGL